MRIPGYNPPPDPATVALGLAPKSNPQEATGPLELIKKASRPPFVSLGKAKRIALAGLDPETAQTVNSYLYANQRKLDMMSVMRGSPRLTDEPISPIESESNVERYFVVPTDALDRAVAFAKRPEGVVKMREYVDLFKNGPTGRARTSQAAQFTRAVTKGAVPSKESVRAQGLAESLPFDVSEYQSALASGSQTVKPKTEWASKYPQGLSTEEAAQAFVNKGLTPPGVDPAKAEAERIEGLGPRRRFGRGGVTDGRIDREAFEADVAGFFADAFGGSPNAQGAGAAISALVSPLVLDAVTAIDQSATPGERAMGAGMTILNLLPIEAGVIVTKGAKYLLGDASYLTRELGKRGIKDASQVAQRLADVVERMPEAQVEQAVDALKQADAQGFLAKAAKAAEGVAETGETLDLKAGLKQEPRRRRSQTVAEPTPIGDKTTPVEPVVKESLITEPTVPRETPQVEGPAYRGTHQIHVNTARRLSDLSNIDDDIDLVRRKYGLTNYDHKDIARLQNILGKSDVDITVYRVAPINELNSGDWVTTDIIYARDIKRQNGGSVHKHTVKSDELYLPQRIEDNPSSSRFSAFQYNKRTPSQIKVESPASRTEGTPVAEAKAGAATEPQAPVDTAFRGARRRSTAEPPKEPPVETTQSEVPQGEPGGTAARHADIDALRKNYGLSERADRYKADESLKAEAQAIEPEAVNVARGANASKRILTDSEQVAVAGGIESRRIKFNAARRAFDEASTRGDNAAKIEAQVTMDALSAEMQDMARALDESGSEAGAAMRARRFVADAVEGGYAEPDITYRFTKATGRQPDRVERRSIQDQAAKIAELEDQVAKAEAKAATDRKFIEELQKGLNSAPRARSSNKVFTQKAYDDAVKRLKVGVSGVRSGTTTIPSDIVDMSIVAGYHIESGLRSLPEIYKAIRAALPDATDAQINLATKHALDQIDAAPKTASKAVKNTIHDLRKEVKSAIKGATNVVDFDTAYNRIDEIEAIIKDPTKGIDDLESAWADLTELRRKYGQGSSYGFDVLVQGKYGVQVEGVSELRYALDRAKRNSQGYLDKARKRAEYESLNDFGKALSKAGTVAREVKNLPAQAVASMDVSYTGRQGLWFSLNPRYRRASKEMFQAQIDALKSQEGYERAAFAIRNNKNFDRLRRGGLIIEGEAFGAGNAEMFESAILGKVSPYKASGRAYEMAGNMQRVQVADDILTGLERLGEPLDDDAVKIVTDYVNAATGRGSSKFTKSLQALQVLWAPRLVGGRMELLAGRPLIKAALYGAKTGDYRLMRRVAEDYAAFGAMMTAVLAGAKLAGADVDFTNPDSADWLKIKLGDTRIDMLGGFQQPARFLYRMYGAMMESASEKESKQRPSEIAIWFGRSKLNPLFGEAANWLIFDREDYIGGKVTPLSTTINLTTPLGLREGVKTTLEGSPEAAALEYFLNLFGISASTYKERPRRRSGPKGVGSGGAKNAPSGI